MRVVATIYSGQSEDIPRIEGRAHQTIGPPSVPEPTKMELSYFTK
jgi:hypothetical protein